LLYKATILVFFCKTGDHHDTTAIDHTIPMISNKRSLHPGNKMPTGKKNSTELLKIPILPMAQVYLPEIQS
jgi:hypothetical protein